MGGKKKKEIPLKELQKHNKPNDCWIAVEGSVYDITKYLSLHPAGAQVCIDVSGRDCTKEFDKAEHSDSAKDTMARYEIGVMKK